MHMTGWTTTMMKIIFLIPDTLGKATKGITLMICIPVLYSWQVTSLAKKVLLGIKHAIANYITVYVLCK